MTEQTQRRRPPAGVIVIAAVFLLAAVAAALVAIIAVVAPGVLRPFDFPSDTRQRVFSTLPFTVAAVLFGAAGYDLLRLGEFARRAVVILLVLQAISRGIDLLDGDDVARHLALLVPSLLGAIYLSLASVKGAFTRRGADVTR